MLTRQAFWFYGKVNNRSWRENLIETEKQLSRASFSGQILVLHHHQITITLSMHMHNDSPTRRTQKTSNIEVEVALFV
jgi:3',5'-cyclic AMP phosphodiesterase CpdA